MGQINNNTSSGSSFNISVSGVLATSGAFTFSNSGNITVSNSGTGAATWYIGSAGAVGSGWTLVQPSTVPAYININIPIVPLNPDKKQFFEEVKRMNGLVAIYEDKVEGVQLVYPKEYLLDFIFKNLSTGYIYPQLEPVFIHDDIASRIYKKPPESKEEWQQMFFLVDAELEEYWKLKSEDRDYLGWIPNDDKKHDANADEAKAESNQVASKA